MGLYADLRFHYGIDLAGVIRGDGPAPSLVYALVRRLPDSSLTAALASGNPATFGYTAELAMLGGIYDAINLNTKATGMWKGKPPDFPLAPRPPSPTTSTGSPKSKVTVAGLYKRISTGGMPSA